MNQRAQDSATHTTIRWRRAFKNKTRGRTHTDKRVIRGGNGMMGFERRTQKLSTSIPLGQHRCTLEPPSVSAADLYSMTLLLPPTAACTNMSHLCAVVCLRCPQHSMHSQASTSSMCGRALGRARADIDHQTRDEKEKKVFIGRTRCVETESELKPVEKEERKDRKERWR